MTRFNQGDSHDGEWDGQQERRKLYVLSEEQIRTIADNAAKKAIDGLYAIIGKSVVKKTVFAVGAGGAVAVAWLNDLIHFGAGKH